MRLIRVCLLLIGAFCTAAAWAQSFPTKPLRLVIGFPPGGSADILARTVGEELSRELGQPVIVDNRPGAGSTIAAGIVAKSPPDGYTLYLTAAGHHGSDETLYKNLPYDSERDFTPITRWVDMPMILAVNKDLGVSTVKDLIARVKSDPGKFNYASSGNGVPPHLAGVLFNRVAGVNMEHVPFKGGSPAVNSVLSGDTQLTFATAPSVISFVESGRLKGLAVTSRDKSPVVSNLPGMEAAGLPGYHLTFWFGLYAAGKPPAEVVKRLHEASLKVLSRSELKEKLARSGMEAAPNATPAEFRALIERDGAQYARLVKESGAKLD